MEALLAVEAQESSARESTTPQSRQKRARAKGSIRRIGSSGRLFDDCDEEETDGPTSAKSMRLSKASDSADEQEGVACHGDADAMAAALCKGCQRTGGASDWFRADEKCLWALPGHRGRWCKECYSCWRTCFAFMGSLALFESWLEAEQANWVAWYQKLVAWLSLCTEQHARIAKVMVEQRESSLRWVFDFSRMPFYPFKVAPLLGHSCLVDASRLVQMVDSKGQPCVGVASFAPPRTRLSTEAEVLLEMAPSAARFPAMAQIQTTSADEKQMLSVMFGSGGDDGTTLSLGRGEASLQTSTNSQSLRKVEALLQNCRRALLATWVSPVWQILAKESHFTPFLVKLAIAKQESSERGSKQDEEDCNDWIRGLTAGKVFARARKTYLKHRKYQQLMATNTHVQEFTQFLLSQSIPAHATLMCLAGKVSYYHALESGSCFGQATAQLCESTMGTLAQASQSSPSPAEPLDPEVWMREAVQHGLSHVLGKLTADNWQEQQVFVTAGVEKAVDALREQIEVKLDALALDLEKVIVLMEVGSASGAQQHSGRALKDAMEMMKSTRMEKVGKFFMTHDVGKIFLGNASAIMQKRACDDIAVGKLQRASSFLVSNEMLSVVYTEGDQVLHIINSNKAFDDVAIRVVLESLALVREAVGLFSSAVQCAEHIDLFQRWASDLRMVVDGIWHAFLAQFFSSVSEVVVAMYKGADDLHSIEDLAASKELLTRFQTIVDPLSSQWPKHEMSQLLTDLAPLVSHESCLGSEVSWLLGTLSAQVAASCAWWGAAMGFCQALGDFAGADFSSDCASVVRQWRLNRAAGKVANAFLDLVVRLQTMAHAFRRHAVNSSLLPDVPEDSKASVTIILDSVDVSVDGSQLTWSRVVDGQDSLLRLPVATESLALLQNLTNEAVLSLVSLLNMNAIRLPTREQVAAMVVDKHAAVDIIDLFTDGKHNPDAARSFRASLVDDNHVFISTDMYALCCELIQTQGSSGESAARYYHGLCIERPSDDEPAASADQSVAMMRVYTGMHGLALALTYARNSVLSGPSPVHEHALRRDVQPLVACMEHLIIGLRRFLHGPMYAEIVQLKLPWLFPPTSVAQWLDALQPLHAHFKRSLLISLLDDAFHVSEVVSKHTPQLEQVVSGGKYHSKLAKAVLARESNASLTAECVELCKCLSTLGKAREELGMAIDLREDADTSEKLTACESAYKLGKAAVTIVAALTILEHKKPEEAGGLAASMLEKKRDQLPGPIVEMLEAAMAKKGAPKAFKKS